MFIKKFSYCVAASCCSLQAFHMTSEQIQWVGKKIWQNECNGTKEGLTTWNPNESCASFSSLHLISYHASKKDRYKETFPSFVTFLQKRNIAIPSWLAKNKSCPWRDRADFYANINSPKMNELRNLLASTIKEQALFAAQQLEKVLPSLTKHCTRSERRHIQRVFNALESTPQGLYALIDYLNFKGAGLAPKERYNNKGWGLKQVLLATDLENSNPLRAFAHAAKKTLQQRVALAPEERKQAEQRWLPGWINRINTYTKV